jgi:hypothetical protein
VLRLSKYEVLSAHARALLIIAQNKKPLKRIIACAKLYAIQEK